MPGTMPTITLSYVEMLLIVLIVLIIYLIIRNRNIESFIETEALIKEGSFGIVEFILNMQTSSEISFHRIYYNLDPNSAKLFRIDYDQFNKLKQALTSDQDYSKSVSERLLQEKRIPDNIKISDMSQGPIIIENASLTSSQYVNMFQDIIRENLQKTITAAIKENKIPVITYTINIQLKGNNYIVIKPVMEEKNCVVIGPVVSNGVSNAIDAVKKESENTQLEFGENKEVEPKKSGLKDIAINMVGGISETFPTEKKQIASIDFENKGKRWLSTINIINYLKEAVKNMDDFR